MVKYARDPTNASKCCKVGTPTPGTSPGPKRCCRLRHKQLGMIPQASTQKASQSHVCAG